MTGFVQAAMEFVQAWACLTWSLSWFAIRAVSNLSAGASSSAVLGSFTDY